MANLQGLDLKRDGLGHLLSDNRLRVPIFQRAYAWKKPHVSDLFDDLDRAIQEGGEGYFLGSVVACHTADGSLEIVDGQQRFATTTILLAAIRDHLLVLKETKAADYVENQYLIRQEGIKNPVFRATLSLSETDNEFFLRRVLSRPGTSEREIKPTRESHRRIVEAATLAAHHIRSIAGDRRPPDQLAIIDSWVDFIRDKAQVIFITVPDHSDAFVIFETLNDRGLELSIADLAKNHLFGRSGTRIEEAKHNWARMTGTLEAVSNTDITKFYIHQLWSSMYGITRDREVFTKIREKIHNETSAMEFSNKLANNAAAYAALRNADHEFWNSFGPNTKRHIRVLNQLRVSQIRVLLMAALDEFEQAEFKKILPFAVSWSVRYLVAGGSPGNLERSYSTHAVRLRKKEITNADGLAKSMATAVPNDEQFRSAFASEGVGKEFLARYYLRCLEKANTSQENPHLAEDDETVGSLEHILPQNPDRTVWLIDEETHERLVNRIGNLALLAPTDNSNRGRDDFSAAKDYYAKSPFTLTQQVATYGDWDEAAMFERQELLANLAVEAWPIS